MGVDLRIIDQKKELLELEIEHLKLLEQENSTVDNALEILKRKKKLLELEIRRQEIRKVLNKNGTKRAEREREGIFETDHGISLS